MGIDERSAADSDRRRGSRIEAGELPELLKYFNVDIGTGELLHSEVLDAGRKGISLLIPIHIYKVKNYDIVLHSMDNSFIIEDEIVYIKGITPEQSRISIMFTSESEGYKRYCDLLESVPGKQ